MPPIIAGEQPIFPPQAIVSAVAVAAADTAGADVPGSSISDAFGADEGATVGALDGVDAG